MVYELKLDHPLAATSTPNYQAESLRPPDDFPISIDAKGKILSVYSSASWNMTPYANERTIFYFGDAPSKSECWLDHENAVFQRRITFYLLFGNRVIRSILTVDGERQILFAVFKLCRDNNISIASLNRYPSVARNIPKVLTPERLHRVILILQELYAARHELGFEILDYQAIQLLSLERQKVANRQRAYIPERIWVYQSKRCLELLSEYCAFQAKFEALYRYCLKAYVEAYGSISVLREVQRNRGGHQRHPFNNSVDNPDYLGKFSDVAMRYGVLEVLSSRTLENERATDSENFSIRQLSNYLSMIQFSGQIYLATFSGMRVGELSSLRAGCLESDTDAINGTSYLLRGETTKTTKDDRALWVTVPSASIAVEAMTSISRLRIEAALHDPNIPVTPGDIANPRLRTRAYEPWGSSRNLGDELRVAKRARLTEWRRNYPKLFDINQLIIRTEDLRIARLLTPTLDPDKYQAGKIWPLGFHQLRRTLAVNAASSEYVSVESTQVQLKHATTSMSIYYGQNHSRLQLNRSMRQDFADAIVESVAMKGAQLSGDRFVSPLGPKHKENIVKNISWKDFKELLKMAKDGKLEIRETAPGICMMRGACPYGGWDYIVKCDSCDKALYDRSKRPQLEALSRDLDIRIKDAKPTDISLISALEAQQKAIRRAIDVLSA